MHALDEIRRGRDVDSVEETLNDTSSSASNLRDALGWLLDRYQRLAEIASVCPQCEDEIQDGVCACNIEP